MTYRGDRWPTLLEAMRRDKKTRGDLLRFVVLDGIGRPSSSTARIRPCCSAAYAEIAGR